MFLLEGDPIEAKERPSSYYRGHPNPSPFPLELGESQKIIRLFPVIYMFFLMLKPLFIRNVRVKESYSIMPFSSLF